MKKVLLSVVFVFFCVLHVAAEVSVTRIFSRQQWPWNHRIHVEYDISGAEEDYPVDIEIKLFDGEEEVAIPANALTGERLGLTKNGTYVVEIDPTVVFPDRTEVTQFSVAAEPALVSDPANTNLLYMVVDLDSGAVEHITQGQILQGSYGRYEINPVSENGVPIESVVWSGVTDGVLYRTQKMVFRRCPAGSFMMGLNADRPVTLTKDFYMGVFEVTHDQEFRIYGSMSTYFTNVTDRACRPSDWRNTVQLRGPVSVNPPYTGNWPEDRGVAANSIMGRLRSIVANGSGLNLAFDLPTEAQWEYACRAGTTGELNDGSPTITKAAMDKLGRYAGNSPIGAESADNKVKHLAADEGGTAIVGSYNPNAWGLYDMHGNVVEYCLDWFKSDLGSDPVTDPEGERFTGTPTANNRVGRGGGWYTAIGGNNLKSGVRHTVSYGGSWKNQGYRVCLVVED